MARSHNLLLLRSDKLGDEIGNNAKVEVSYTTT